MGDTSTALILLRPRSLAKGAGSFFLLPLLPTRPLVKPLPAEIWTRILEHVFEGFEADESLLGCRERSKQGLQLLLISKELKVCMRDDNRIIGVSFIHICGSIEYCTTVILCAHIHSLPRSLEWFRCSTPFCRADVGFYSPHPLFHSWTLGPDY